MTARNIPRRVCLLTGGGDAPGLNAVVRGFVHRATQSELTVFGSRYGLEGLLGRDEVVPLGLHDVGGILPRGGSILGCSTRSNPLAVSETDETRKAAFSTVSRRLHELKIDALVLAGGDGTMAIAARFAESGIACVGIPKTIDGDLGGTERTCGFDTAVQVATHAIDALHSTAEAHQRVLVLEVMGRNAGLIALHSAIAGGADVALLPEIPYDVIRVAAKIRDRERRGLRFSIVVVGEGARPIGGTASQIESAARQRPARLGGAAERLMHELQEARLEHDVRTTVLGHLQRGGTPSAFDRLLGTRFGVHAAGLCAEGRFGRMVSLRSGHVDSIPLAEACAARAGVDPEGELVRCARAVGIELGAA